MDWIIDKIYWLAGGLLGVALLVLAVFLGKEIYDRFHQAYKIQWFRPLKHGKAQKYNWADVREILYHDPLRKLSDAQWSGYYKALFLVTLLLSAIILVGIFLLFLALMLKGKAATQEDHSLLTSEAGIPAALVALSGALYISFSELRAKVRSENRQKWIDEVRKNIAIVLNYLGYDYEKKNNSLDKIDPNKNSYLFPDVNQARMTLELLLNPSEKDHRTLSSLLRLACGLKLIPIDKPVVKALMEHPEIPNVHYDDTKPDESIRAFLGHQAAKEKTGESELLITWIIRLSNALLKREWELVKYGK